MIEIVAAGEILVEIMRPKIGVPLNVINSFKGLYPSRAPAIFKDTVSKLGYEAAILVVWVMMSLEKIVN